MTAPVPVPDGTTPPRAVLAAAVQDALDAVGCELTTSDCRIAAAAVVAALRLPERDRETAAKALDDAADADDWDSALGRANVRVRLRARASALRERRES